MFLLSILLCLIAGNAIDTSNICVVRAAGDLVSGRPAVTVSVMFCAACAAVVFYLTTLLGLHRAPPPWAYPTLLTLGGAAVFASGALLNGACAIGTLGRLARGDVGYAATLVGGTAVAFLLPRAQPASQTPDVPIMSGLTWLLLMAAVAAAALLLARRHVRLDRLPAYATLGVTAAVINNWQGDWTWTGVMQTLRVGMPAPWAIILCLTAVMIGAAVTALYRHHFRYVPPDPRVMAREAAGGGLMAVGSLMIPGGSDSLLAFGVPSGSPHAVAAYVVMFAIIAGVLHFAPFFRRWSVWPVPRPPGPAD